MISNYEIIVSGSEGIYGMIIICFLFSILTAARFGSKDNGPTNLMIYINKVTSLFLFLIPFNRKITVWAVLMQLFTYVTFVSFTFLDVVLKINSKGIDRTFALIIAIYMGVFLVMLIIDVIVYDVRNKNII
ncbi:hypothetical protein [Bacillus cihuensis]|uniref:hypothetical protein n=1 Tax=Bacillus cihuensis TaxID=1208599 RepID=UPI0003FBC472|nr:hypothetical protein [Bacillus cihuensis]